MERRRLVSRQGGRPRSTEVHTAILHAAIGLISEVGYDALSIDAIVARAGVGKAAVYRRWASKELLVAEAIALVMRATPVPDTGSLRGDLRILIRSQLKLFRLPRSATMLTGLVAAMGRSGKIAKAVRTGFLAVRRDALRAVLVRGGLRTEAELELALDLLSGAPFYRLAVTGGRLDDRFGDHLIDAVLGGIAP